MGLNNDIYSCSDLLLSRSSQMENIYSLCNQLSDEINVIRKVAISSLLRNGLRIYVRN